MKVQAASVVTFDQFRHGNMSHTRDAHAGAGQPPIYEIRIRGHLGQHWVDWFGGLAITLEEAGETLLTGPVVDQAALYGLLRRVRDVGLPLISVAQINVDGPGSLRRDAACATDSGIISTATRTASNDRKGRDTE